MWKESGSSTMGGKSNLSSKKWILASFANVKEAEGVQNNSLNLRGQDVVGGRFVVNMESWEGLGMENAMAKSSNCNNGSREGLMGHLEGAYGGLENRMGLAVEVEVVEGSDKNKDSQEVLAKKLNMVEGVNGSGSNERAKFNSRYLFAIPRFISD